MARMYQFKDDQWHCSDCDWHGMHYKDWETHVCADHNQRYRPNVVEDFEAPPATGEPNYIVLTHPSQNTEEMYRAPQMVWVAGRQNNVVVFGVDSNAPATDPNRKKARLFMDSEDPLVIGADSFVWNHHASDWMRDVVARYDMNLRRLSGPVVLDIRCQEGLIIPAAGSLEMQVNGGGRAAVNLQKFGKKAN